MLANSQNNRTESLSILYKNIVAGTNAVIILMRK